MNKPEFIAKLEEINWPKDLKDIEKIEAVLEKQR